MVWPRKYPDTDLEPTNLKCEACGHLWGVIGKASIARTVVKYVRIKQRLQKCPKCHLMEHVKVMIDNH